MIDVPLKKKIECIVGQNEIDSVNKIIICRGNLYLQNKIRKLHEWSRNFSLGTRLKKQVYKQDDEMSRSWVGFLCCKKYVS